MKYNILEEAIDYNNKQYKDNSDIELKNSNLGQIAQIIDLIINKKESVSSKLKEVYLKILKCDESELTCDTKDFVPYKENIIKYSLVKDKKYQYNQLDDFTNYNDESILSEYKSKNKYRNNKIVNISNKDTVRLPVEVHSSVKIGNTSIIIRTESDYSCFKIIFIYKNSDEQVVDKYYQYLLDLINKNNFYKSSKITPKLEFINLKKLNWNDIVLDEEIKDKITYNIIDFFEKEEIYKKNGISSKCGLIWEGPPGTGKTLAAQILANQLKDITFIWVTPDDLRYSCDVKNIYEIARDLNPSIIFFEDADLFCSSRGHSGDHSILGEIMNQLDGLVPLEGVVTIFTTNDSSVMEDAIIDRPGRFDEKILFLPPKGNNIVKIIKKSISKPSYDLSDIKELSKKIEELELTGAHIKRLCDLATIYAIKDNSVNEQNIAILKKIYFDKAFNNIKDMRIKAGNKIEIKKENIKTNKKRIIENNKKNDRFNYKTKSIISELFN